MNILCLILAVLSIWDYPARHPTHTRLRRQFVVAVKEGDTPTMEETCRKGVALLPDDPTWHFNLACALAYFKDRQNEAFDELEKAIDLGFRDKEAIVRDTDLKRLEALPRYKELIEYAELMARRPLMTGPLATAAATGVFGKSIALGEQNMGWNFDLGCFVAKMKLVAASSEGNVGDLYMNRDGLHSPRDMAGFLKSFPGLTTVRLDEEGRRRYLDQSYPNVEFPYPVFGNASLAITQPPFWRSLPRAMMTTEVRHLNKMCQFYLSNQTWVFPSHQDTAPVGTNGDVFASITPYWLTTAGRSWSDEHYLRAALTASGVMQPAVKRWIVDHRLLAPTIQVLIRKSLIGVTNEVDYLSARAHPSALPPNAVDMVRLRSAARSLTVEAVPPLAAVSVTTPPLPQKTPWPELTYATAFAWAYVLRSDQEERVFDIETRGASEYAFVQTHGTGVDVRIERLKPNRARVTLKRSGLSPTNRVDIAVFGRNPKTGWGAPSYISFARMDPSAPYSDPALTTLPEPAAK